VEDGILLPQSLKLTGSGSGTLLIRCQTRTVLHARPGGVVPQPLKLAGGGSGSLLVLPVPNQRSHHGMEVRALEIRHVLKALLPYGVLLIPNQEKRDRQYC
jgi:hypothetical protein